MITAKAIRIAAAVIVFLLCCLVAVGAAFCAFTLQVPKYVSSAPPKAETVELTARDNVTLRAWWLRADAPNGNCVVVLHGIADSRSGSIRFAPMFLNEGYSVLLPDSRAHGESGGKFVTYGLLEKYDAIGWTRWMKRAGCQKVYGLGESLGASILIEAAALEPAFAAIVAECPYADLQAMGEYRLRRRMPLPAVLNVPMARAVMAIGRVYAKHVDGLDFRQVAPLESIRKSTTPILLIHGLDDSRTPPSQSEALAAANRNNALWLVPHATHIGASAAAPDEFRRRVLAWFANPPKTR